MVSARVLRGLCLVCRPRLRSFQVAPADYYTLIVKGTRHAGRHASAQDCGNRTGVQRCSGIGAWPPCRQERATTMKMNLDPEKPRVCFLRATLPGFTSTRVDLDKINLNDFQRNRFLR